MIPTAIISLVITFLALMTVFKGIRIVPQQSVWIVEKLGKFDRVLEPGLNFIIPYVECVTYKQSLKKHQMDVGKEAAVTCDNVNLLVDGIIYFKNVDPIEKFYPEEGSALAFAQLIRTAIRSEINKITMVMTFQERDIVNSNILNAINQVINIRDIQCIRCEIRNIIRTRSIDRSVNSIC